MAYNEPLQYSGKRVLVVGSKSSGTDLAREIASVAQSVFVSDRSLACENQATYGNIHHMPAINHFTDTGVVFNTGTRSDSIEIDAIVWCTGFLYDFPFLNTTESVSNDGDDGDEDDDGARVSPTGRYVQNLYQHVFSIKDQTLAFIGLPYTVIPFPLMELQSQWIASVWSNHTQLPSKQEQRLWLKNDMQSAATLRHKDLSSYHFMGALQWDYFRFLIESARLNDTNQRLEYFKMLQEIWNHVGTTRPVYPGGPDVYRENIYTINYNDFTWTVSTQKGALQ
ncbi:hypothetical protein BDR26DRAFT_858826 [Obelidium mucronatum]|nr:hypothetical protein BDR26DRAFT_858826 [Obelidium mucronatum]